MNTPARPPSVRYRIRILGHLDPVWSVWFDGLSLIQVDDGTTELVGRWSTRRRCSGCWPGCAT
jgi:hypothetical protein